MNNTPFSQQLAFLNKGLLEDELTAELAEVVKQVRETGKKGSITLKLDISMLNTRDENAVRITPEVKSNVPQLAAYQSIMFSTADGDLLRDDPNQRSLDLQQVTKVEKGPLKEIK